MLDVEITDEYIRIYEEDGEELVGWDCQEWGEDGTIVPSIVNAVHLAHTNPDLLRDLLNEARGQV